METKRYALFVGLKFDPGGGWQDFAGWFDTEAEAIAAKTKPEDPGSWWWEVVDLHIGAVVAEGEEQTITTTRPNGFGVAFGASNTDPTPNLDAFLKDFEP